MCVWVGGEGRQGVCHTVHVGVCVCVLIVWACGVLHVCGVCAWGACGGSTPYSTHCGYCLICKVLTRCVNMLCKQVCFISCQVRAIS